MTYIVNLWMMPANDFVPVATGLAAQTHKCIKQRDHALYQKIILEVARGCQGT
jgi:hypothetical protein